MPWAGAYILFSLIIACAIPFFEYSESGHSDYDGYKEDYIGFALVLALPAMLFSLSLGSNHLLRVILLYISVFLKILILLAIFHGSISEGEFSYLLAFIFISILGFFAINERGLKEYKN